MNKNNTAIIVLLVILIALVAYVAFRPNHSMDRNLPVIDNSPVNTNNSSSNTPNQSSSVKTITPAPITQADPNMIIKASWGIAFSKPMDWDISSNSNTQTVFKEAVADGDTLTIDYISGNNVTDTDAKFGTTVLYFDVPSNQWMKIEDETGTPTASVARPITTVSGYPVFLGVGRWRTYLIPLSHTTFLKMNITGSGNTKPLEDLVKTIKKI